MKKLKFGKMFVAITFFIITSVVGILSVLSVKATDDLSCAQVITPAQNSTTGECKDFSTPCDVPVGWNKVESCPISSDKLTITVLSPNGGETWAKGTKQTIKWQDNTPTPTCTNSTSSGISSTCADNARLYDINLVTYSSPCPAGMACVQSASAIYKIVKNISVNYYNWIIGAIQELSDGLVPEGSYTIQVCQSGTSTCDSSDSYFKIADQPKVCAACVGGADTGKTDANGCPIYLCPGQTCGVPVCKDGSKLYDTGKINSFGCIIHECVSQTCSRPVCDGGNFINTGKVDSSGCTVYSCQETNVISEKVKCWFKGSQTEQKCYAAVDNDGLSCSGKESCIMDVVRTKGEKITWKSSCGGYAYTTMDGTGGYDGRGEYAEFNCVPAAIPSDVSTLPATTKVQAPTATPKITENKVEIIEMKYIAKDMADDKYDSILSELKQLRNIVKEQQNEIKYLKSLASDLKDLSEKMKNAINDFITYGVDANTVKLGAGERAAVINSYKAAFAKLPETEAELTDAIKIANGRFPSLISDKAEKAAKEQFIKIYKRVPDLNDPKDNVAIKVMAYGLRQKAENRNLNSEKSGIKTFKSIYGYTPKTTEDWNTMQAITYSGAAREKDSDGDLLSDEMEAQYGTNPNKADTDGDGFKDGAEVNGGFNPKGEGKL